MEDQAPYTFIAPKGKPIPILVSSPHSGTSIPKAIADSMNFKVMIELPDTDWFVHELYSFVTDMGISLVYSNFSRYVIDLNRDPANVNLYNDGRRETLVLPTATFNGIPIYKDGPLDSIEARLAKYYNPYHDFIRDRLRDLKTEFGAALLFDAHSIRRSHSVLQIDPCPDLIVGTNNGASAAPALQQVFVNSLKRDEYIVSENDPFQGGYITRHFGKPSEGIHAVQLEMCQDVYMDTDKVEIDETKQKKIRALLESTFRNLARMIVELK